MQHCFWDFTVPNRIILHSNPSWKGVAWFRFLMYESNYKKVKSIIFYRLQNIIRKKSFSCHFCIDDMLHIIIMITIDLISKKLFPLETLKFGWRNIDMQFKCFLRKSSVDLRVLFYLKSEFYEKTCFLSKGICYNSFF